MYRSISDIPLNFEITRVNCIFISSAYHIYLTYWDILPPYHTSPKKSVLLPDDMSNVCWLSDKQCRPTKFCGVLIKVCTVCSDPFVPVIRLNTLLLQK